MSDDTYTCPDPTMAVCLAILHAPLDRAVIFERFANMGSDPVVEPIDLPHYEDLPETAPLTDNNDVVRYWISLSRKEGQLKGMNALMIKVLLHAQDPRNESASLLMTDELDGGEDDEEASSWSWAESSLSGVGRPLDPPQPTMGLGTTQDGDITSDTTLDTTSPTSTPNHLVGICDYVGTFKILGSKVHISGLRTLQQVKAAVRGFVQTMVKWEALPQVGTVTPSDPVPTVPVVPDGVDTDATTLTSTSTDLTHQIPPTITPTAPNITSVPETDSEVPPTPTSISHQPPPTYEVLCIKRIVANVNYTIPDLPDAHDVAIHIKDILRGNPAVVHVDVPHRDGTTTHDPLVYWLPVDNTQTTKANPPRTFYICLANGEVPSVDLEEDAAEPIETDGCASGSTSAEGVAQVLRRYNEVSYMLKSRGSGSITQSCPSWETIVPAHKLLLEVVAGVKARVAEQE